MIPLSADEIESFTPESLKNLSPRVVFRLRPATPRDLRVFHRQAMIEGLATHDVVSIRRVQLAELEKLWSIEKFTEYRDRLEMAWAANDQGVEIEPAEMAHLNELLNYLQQASRPLRAMIADNSAFERDAPKIMLGIIMDGWSGIDVPFEREGGIVPLAVLDAAEEMLAKIENASGDSVKGIMPGLGWAQLCHRAIDAMSFNRADEGKSQSPSPLSSDQNGLTSTSLPPAASSSEASPIMKTPRARSKRQIAN
jgi:hypothetical protein